ncbi:MAG: Fur family transcriptional regulator [Patescibacteria group bacterium]
MDTTVKRPRSRDCERLLVLLDMLRSRHDHPDANTCYSDMRQIIPNIGQSTVYRHLSSLVEKGLINEIKIDSGPTKYDATLDLHGHFQCTSCYQVWDVSPINIQANFPGIITSATYVAKGICHNCSKTSNR